MKIRQGKDILIRWKVLTNGQDVSLESRSITLVMTTPLGREKVVEHEVEGSVVVARLRGTALTHIGDYTLTLWENRGEEGQTAVDAVDAFTLVQYSTQEDDGSPCGNLEYEVAQLATASMDVLTGGGGGGIVSVEVVDNLESDASDKALSANQGRVLKDMIPTQVSELENDKGYITEIPDNLATKDDVSEAVSGKQDALTLTVKDNGNIVIGNISGQFKEFMPATPSGDPMHWAYVSAGAEYNDSGEDIVKDAPWAALADTDEEKKVTHKAGCWYLNGVGDMTNDDIRHSYTNRTLIRDLNKRASYSHDTTIRTIYSVNQGTTVSGFGPTKSSTFFGCKKLETILLSDMKKMLKEKDYSLSLSATHEFYGCKTLKAIGQVTPTNDGNLRFEGCTSLRYIWIYALNASINLKDSSLISKLSIKHMIENSAPTSAITITLHPDAYARLAEDADIVAALEAQPLVTLVNA